MQRPIFRLVGLLVLLVASGALAENPPTEAWVQEWNGPGNFNDEGFLISTDPSGPIYVAGTTLEPVPGQLDDVLLQRLDLEGNLIWTRIHGVAGNDKPSALIVAANGDVVVAGTAREGVQISLFSLRYSAAGELIWSTSFPLSEPLHEHFIPRLVEDQQGSLVISGTTNSNFLVLKYAGDGTFLWDQSYDSPGSGTDQASGVAVDSQGGIYVTGIVYESAGDAAVVTVKFDADGAFQWTHAEYGDFGSVFQFADVRVGPDDEPVVVGNTESTCGLFQVRTYKLEAATGEAQWLAVFPENPCDSMEPVDMAIDQEGNVVVTGFGLYGDTEYHFQTMRYDAQGQLLWHRTFDGVGTSSDQASSLALDGQGNVYVAGLTTFPPQNRDFTAVKYNTLGEEAWSVHWAGPAGTNEGANDVAVTASGEVILTGKTWKSGESDNLVTIMYQQQILSAVTPLITPAGLTVQAGLNPFSFDTSIRFRVGQSGGVRLSVFDLRGRRVRVLQDGYADAGNHEVGWQGDDEQGRSLPSGVYFLKLESARGIASARVALVR
jgi:outer membrane protein assembly factor BamB